MLTLNIFRKFKRNKTIERPLSTVPPEQDYKPEIIMPKGLTWEEKRIWALETFRRECKRIDEESPYKL